MSDFWRDPFRNGSYDRWKLASPPEPDEAEEREPDSPDEPDTMTTSEDAPVVELPLPAEYDEEA